MFDLLINAIVAGLLLGGFYSALTLGISISFGILNIVNIAHAAFIILGAYAAYFLNSNFGIDPILASLIAVPAFFALGAAIYQIYYVSFERRDDESMRGLAFFFGLMIIIEVLLLVIFGVDLRYVTTAYTETTYRLGFIDVPSRMLVPFLVASIMVGITIVWLRHSFVGNVILAVSQDMSALKFVAVNPIRVKRLAFALSVATASVAGALLIVIQPIEPSIGREYIGRVFAICVLGGLQSLRGMVVGSMLVGIAESLTSSYFGPSWAPAVSFSILLLALAFRPSGLFAR